MPPAVAIAGITAAAGIGGSVMASGAAKGAANTAAAAQDRASQATIAEQRRQYDQTRNDLGGYRDAGSAALAQQMNLLGIGGTPASRGGVTDWAAYVNGNPDALANWNAIKGTSDGAQFNGDIGAFGQYHYGADGSRRDLAPYTSGATPGIGAADAQQSAIDQLRASPLYESLFRNGQNTLLANASATGGLRGGNTQGALANFGRDTLSQVIENQLTRLGGVAQQGQNAAAQTGAFGANSANAIGQALGDAGAAKAGAALASGAASAGAIKDITGSIAGLANNQDVQKWAGKLF